MLHRVLTSTLLSFCLALTGLAVVVAETRTAAAGTFCGTGAPQLLLDEHGLPLLDAQGKAVGAPDCPTCHLTLALTDPATPLLPAVTLLTPPQAPAPVRVSPLSLRLDQNARAPPHAA